MLRPLEGILPSSLRKRHGFMLPFLVKYLIWAMQEPTSDAVHQIAMTVQEDNDTPIQP